MIYLNYDAQIHVWIAERRPSLGGDRTANAGCGHHNLAALNFTKHFETCAGES